MSEFSENEKCKLLVKTNNLTKQDYKKLTKLIGDRKDIEIINKSLSRSDLYNLISSADCLISLHRAEGFGLPLAEAMMLNTLVVATNYSSTTDFVNEKSAYVVDYKLIESNISIAIIRFSIGNEPWISVCTPIATTERINGTLQNTNPLKT